MRGYGGWRGHEDGAVTQWWFVTAAYVVTLGGTAALVGISFVAMRRAERK